MKEQQSKFYSSQDDDEKGARTSRLGDDLHKNSIDLEEGTMGSGSHTPY